MPIIRRRVISLRAHTGTFLGTPLMHDAIVKHFPFLYLIFTFSIYEFAGARIWSIFSDTYNQLRFLLIRGVGDYVGGPIMK